MYSDVYVSMYVRYVMCSGSMECWRFANTEGVFFAVWKRGVWLGIFVFSGDFKRYYSCIKILFVFIQSRVCTGFVRCIIA